MPTVQTRRVQVQGLDYDVYCGRAAYCPLGWTGAGSKGEYGNYAPGYKLEVHAAWFRAKLLLSDGYAEKIEALRGKRLACFCAPGAPCHVDNIIDYLDRDAAPATPHDSAMRLLAGALPTTSRPQMPGAHCTVEIPPMPVPTIRELIRPYQTEIARAYLGATEGLDYVLSTDQRTAVLGLVGRICVHADHPKAALPKHYASLAGPAGSGKTTILRVLVGVLERLEFAIVLASPTGKAAARMVEVFDGQREASTVHGLIYSRPVAMGMCPFCDKPSVVLAIPAGKARAQGVIGVDCPHADCGETVPLAALPLPSVLQFSEADADLTGRSVAFVDEASMITADMHADLLSAAAPPGETPGCIAYIGDPYQLPPIETKADKKRERPDLKNPTVMLSTVHRQAKGSGILKWATLARNGAGKTLLRLPAEKDACVMSWKLAVCAEHAGEAYAKGEDIVALAYTNATRNKLNAMIRASFLRHQGIETTAEVHDGEPIQCIANNKTLGLMNGEVFRATNPRAVDGSPGIVAVSHTTLGDLYLIPELFGAPFGEFSFQTHRDVNRCERARKDWLATGKTQWPDFDDYLAFHGTINATRFVHVDYGYAMTVHKSQGSQWDEVIYVWERATWGMAYHDATAFNEHLYTGITRASKRLTIYVPPKGDT